MNDIRKSRLFKKLTQTVVALHCGVSVNAFRAWENGTSIPRKSHEEKLKEMLGDYDRGTRE